MKAAMGVAAGLHWRRRLRPLQGCSQAATELVAELVRGVTVRGPRSS